MNKIKIQFYGKPKPHLNGSAPPHFFLSLFFLSFFVTGQLLDATKSYMYVFLLAGSEVVLSGLVLATCNFFFIKKKPHEPAVCLGEMVTLADDEIKQLSSRAEEQLTTEEEMQKEVVNENKNNDNVRPKSVAVDSQEVERFLKEPQANGDMAACPETCL